MSLVKRFSLLCALVVVLVVGLSAPGEAQGRGGQGGGGAVAVGARVAGPGAVEAVEAVLLGAAPSSSPVRLRPPLLRLLRPSLLWRLLLAVLVRMGPGLLGWLRLLRLLRLSVRRPIIHTRTAATHTATRRPTARCASRSPRRRPRSTSTATTPASSTTSTACFSGCVLPPGSHELTLYRDGYRTVHQTMYLTADSTFKVHYNMEKLAPGDVAEPRPTAEGAAA